MSDRRSSHDALGWQLRARDILGPPVAEPPW